MAVVPITVWVSVKNQTVPAASRHVISGMVALSMLPAPVGGDAAPMTASKYDALNGRQAYSAYQENNVD